MEIAKLFDILASYLNFFIDLLLLHGVEKYKRLGVIDAQLVSFFVAGVLIAYLISAIQKIPGYEVKIPSGKDSGLPLADRASDDLARPQANKQDAAPEDKRDMAVFILMSIIGGLVFHGSLLLYHRLVKSTEIGNVKDTLNAVFAVNAVYNPANAALKQLQRLGNAIGRTAANAVAKLLGLLLLLGVSAAYFGGLYYWVYALAAVHGTSRTYMLGPIGVMSVVGVFIGIAVLQRSPRSAPAEKAETSVVT